MRRFAETRVRIAVGFLFCTVLALSLCAQAPQLSGRIELDLRSGQISCEWVISQLPPMSDLAIALHRGMNVKSLRLDGRLISYNVDWGLPGRTVYLAEGVGIVPNVDSLVGRSTLSIAYTGAFPVYGPREFVPAKDGMGEIAVKGGVIRATHQSLWYPVLVDRENNRIVTAYTFDIRVRCRNCNSIYIGGALPRQTKNGRFVAETPHDLLLYAGDYRFQRQGDVFFLNTALNRGDQIALGQTIERIKAFYADWLDVLPAEKPLVLAQIFSLREKLQYDNWAFAVLPCIVMDLSRLSGQTDFFSHDNNALEQYRVISHEMAHEYFGLQLKSTNAYWGFYSESFAEYLCLKAIEHQFGAERYRAFVEARYLTEKALARTYAPLDEQVNTAYLYFYYPMLLLGLEHTAGNDKMALLLQYLLKNTRQMDLDYQYLKQAALQSGITTEEWAVFEREYVHAANCLSRIKYDFTTK
jgi:hypothetical protein